MKYIIKAAESKVIPLALSAITTIALILITIVLTDFVAEMRCTIIQATTNKHAIETCVTKINHNTGEIVYIKEKIRDL